MVAKTADWHTQQQPAPQAPDILRADEDPPVVITLSEELTEETRAHFEDLCEITILGSPGRRIVLDLEECPFVSEEGVQALLRLSTLAENGMCALEFRLPPRVRRKLVGTMGLGGVLRMIEAER